MTTYHIDNYRFGKITVSGVSYTRDLIILPKLIISDWWRKKGHLLQLDDLSDVLKLRPDLLIIGLGASSRMQLAPGVGSALTEAGIKWTALPTGDACREFNRKAPEIETAAALHLTC